MRMGADGTKRISKSLSYVLRHRPDMVGIELDEAGWVDVQVLLDAMNDHGKSITREQLDQVVATNDKRRFSISSDGTMIRANQGHSVSVELGYSQAVPPETLYHGTVERFLPLIQKDGLQKRKRHHVHLSPSTETAGKVGQRRGKPLILLVRAKVMHDAEHQFYQTPNDVWLVNSVPPEFIQFPRAD